MIVSYVPREITRGAFLGHEGVIDRIEEIEIGCKDGILNTQII